MNEMPPSELRQDPVSGEWMILAPLSDARPSDFRANRPPRISSDPTTCPFEDPQKSGNADPVLIYPDDTRAKDWRVQILPNKFPILDPAARTVRSEEHGPHATRPGRGYHDLLITRDHDATFPLLSEQDAQLVFEGFKDRFLQVAQDTHIAYIVMFQNWGGAAGASIYHPHYQIISLPLVPQAVHQSLAGARTFAKKNIHCIFCELIKWERKENKRILFETEDVIVYAPFFSKEPFELRIFPKNHAPYFERSSEKERTAMAHALQRTLSILFKELKDPDYNFFIHTAPVKQQARYAEYHWHIEIIPRIGRGKEGGFEMSMGMQVNRVDPIDAIRILRG